MPPANPPTLDEIVKGLHEACPSSCYLQTDGVWRIVTPYRLIDCGWPGHALADAIPGMVAKIAHTAAMTMWADCRDEFNEACEAGDYGRFEDSLARLEKDAERRAKEDSHD